MQQMYEQCSRWFSSREPAHWTKANEAGSLLSPGLRILPWVGPLSAAKRSIIMLVMIAGEEAKLRLVMLLAS